MSGHAPTPEPSAKRSLVPMAIAAAIVALAGAYSASAALEQQTVIQGLNACIDWCNSHNPPGANRNGASRRAIGTGSATAEMRRNSRDS